MPRRSHSAVWSSSMSSPPSVTEGGAIGSGIRAAHEAAVGIEPDAMGVAEEIVPLLAHLYVVAAGGEVAREGGLVAALEIEGSRGRAPRTAIEPARRFHARLRPQAAVEPSREKCGLRLGLALAAHGSVDEARSARLQIHGGDERMHRQLPRRERVGLGRIEGEERAAVLEDDTGVAGDQPRAPGEVERLDERD